jgi:hypothetical protein
MSERRAQLAQVIGSLIGAAVIVAIVLIAVTAELGPTSVAELEAREERQERRLEAREERLEQRQELLEERRR